MKTEPLPCPFCGHVGVNVHEAATYRWCVAECDYCGAQTGEVRRNTMRQEMDETDKEKAIAEWNTRATSKDQRAHRAMLGRCLSVIDTLDGEDNTEWEMLNYLRDDIKQAIGLKPEVPGSLL